MSGRKLLGWAEAMSNNVRAILVCPECKGVGLLKGEICPACCGCREVGTIGTFADVVRFVEKWSKKENDEQVGVS